MNDKHVHEWAEVAKQYEGVSLLWFKCKRCDEPITPEEVVLRLNATERLSAEQAMTFSFTIRQLARLVGEITEKASGDTRLLEFVNGGITEDQLQNYASALEKD